MCRSDLEKPAGRGREGRYSGGIRERAGEGQLALVLTVPAFNASASSTPGPHL